jgi:NADH:ubiquinone oxidoreductase subunit E
MSTQSVDLSDLLDGRKSQPSQLVEVMLDVQDKYGYVPQAAMLALSRDLGVPLIEVWRVAHFYKAFSLDPRGQHVITVCLGTACHVRGAPRALDQVTAELGIGPGGTTEDGLFTLEVVNCLGTCALGPVVVMDGVYHEHMSPRKLSRLLASARKAAPEEAIHA